MTSLPTDIQAEYPSRGPGDDIHHQHHDIIHGALNGLTEGTLTAPLEATLDARYETDYWATTFGATGDSATDDTTFIQAMLDQMVLAKGAGLSSRLPAGTFRITDTLTIPSLSGGFTIRGAGQYVGDPRTGTRKGPQTVLVWDGLVGGTMIEMEGTNAVKIADMTLVGRPTSGSANRAAIGISYSTNASAFTGLARHEGVTFYDFDTAVKCDGDATSDPAGDIHFDYVTFESCDVGLHNVGTNSLNFKFGVLSANNVPRVVWLEGGGGLYVRGANLVTCGGSGADDWCFDFGALGGTSGMVLIDGIRIEQNTKQLVRAEDYGYVEIRGLTEAQADQNVTMFDLNGVGLIVRDSYLVTCDATTPTFSLDWSTGSHRGGLVVEDTILAATTFKFGEWVSYASVSKSIEARFNRCRYGSQALPLPNFGARLEHGPVVHRAKTTNATATWTLLTGLTSNFYNTCQIPTGTTWIVDVYIVGQEFTTGTDVATFHRRVTVKNAGGVTALVGAMQTIGTDQNTDAWAVDVQAVDAFDALRTLVTGKASTSIDWTTTYVGHQVGLAVDV